MTKQKFELGQKVWAFKQEGEGFVKAFGVVRMVEINKSGYIQYQIKCFTKTITGEEKEYTILANHASMACTESELEQKIKKYYEWSEAQKKDYEENFGAPEFDVNTLDEEIRG